MSRTTHQQHLRRGRYDRLRRAKHLQGFLDENATDLTGTAAVIALTVSSGVITSASHGLGVGDGPFLADADTDAVLPTPLSATIHYWIATVPDANTFTLTVKGGAAITLTDDGSPGTGSGLSVSKGESSNAMHEYLKVNSPATLRDATDVDAL